MKKLLVGCLVISVVAVVGLGVGAFLLYRAASPVIDNARLYLSQLSKIDDLDRRITNQAPFHPPDSTELTEAQVARFARVQDAVRSALGQRMREIETKYESLQGGAGQPAPSIGQLLGALSDLSAVALEARQVQVDALNAQQFSRAEYSWVRKQVLEAAGVEAASLIDLGQLEQAIRDGTGIEDVRMPKVPESSVPAQNRVLIKPYLDQVKAWLPLAFFGI